MLNKAFKSRPHSKGCILHSDQGWQYQHSSYQETLKNHAIIQSMSRKGNCLDNSVMENFFGLLKSELLYLEKFTSYEDFINKLRDYIDYYNTKRIKLKQKEVMTIIVTSFLCIFCYIYCLTNVFSMFSTHSLFQAVDYHFVHVET